MNEMTLQSMKTMAEIFARSRLVTQTDPGDLFVLMQTGSELGMTPMMAIRSIHVIKGKPTLSADLMHGRAEVSEVRHHGDVAVRERGRSQGHEGDGFGVLGDLPSGGGGPGRSRIDGSRGGLHEGLDGVEGRADLDTDSVFAGRAEVADSQFVECLRSGIIRCGRITGQPRQAKAQ